MQLTNIQIYQMKYIILKILKHILCNFMQCKKKNNIINEYDINQNNCNTAK